jgi:hypothetical protein
MRGLPLRKWLPLAALMSAAVAGPASAQADVCVRLKDLTGTLVEITDLGTIQTILCHRIPLLNSALNGDKLQGYVICADGKVALAAVSGDPDLSDALTTGIAAGNCPGPYTSEFDPDNPLVPKVTFLTPDQANGDTFTVPVGTQVTVRTIAKGPALGVESWFTFTGGSCEICVTRKVFTTGGARTLSQIKEIADFDVSDHVGPQSRSVILNQSYGVSKNKLAIRLVDHESFGSAVVFQLSGNFRGATGKNHPSQALSFARGDIEEEFTSCLPSDSATRDLATGDRVAELFLNFRDDYGAGGVPLAAVAQSGSEFFYSFCINVD